VTVARDAPVSQGRGAEVVWLALLSVALPWSYDAAELVRSRGSTSKALLSVGVVSLAVLVRSRSSYRWGLSLRLLFAYSTVAILAAVVTEGAAGGGSLFRAARLALFVVVTVRVASVIPVLRLAESLVRFAVGLAGLAIVAALVGLSPWSLARLGGFLPPLHPNALAQVVGLGLAVQLALWVCRQASGRRTALVGALLATTLVLTTSRTGLAALVCATLVTFLLREGRQRGAGALAVLTLLVTASLLAGDPLDVQSLIVPADKPTDLTFTGRTYAWDAAWRYHEGNPTQGAVGAGLAVKTIPVKRFGVGAQAIDGTWPSAFVQVGLLGLLLLGGSVLWGLAVALRWPGKDHPPPWQPVAVSMLLFLSIQSLLESTLNDVTLSLVVLVAVFLKVDQTRLSTGPGAGNERRARAVA